MLWVTLCCLFPQGNQFRPTLAIVSVGSLRGYLRIVFLPKLLFRFLQKSQALDKIPPLIRDPHGEEVEITDSVTLTSFPSEAQNSFQ